MERNRRNKGWALFGLALFFLLLISLAVPANEKFDKFENNNQGDVELETENQYNGDGHFNKTNNFGDSDNNSTTLADGEKSIHRQDKRPARLLPLQLLYIVKNDSDEKVIAKEFDGPPTSCDDLSTLGYTLNGHYLVNGKNVSENQHKVEMIACLFKKPTGIEEGKKEERFGLVSILKGSNKIDEASTSNGMSNAKGVRRLKRPARLIPMKLLLDGAEKNATDMRFYGPATNCSELRQLGYTLNGYYLVKGKDEIIKSEVEVVYCRFKLPNAMGFRQVLRIKEERLGFINLSPSGSNTTILDTFNNTRKIRNTKLFKRPARLLPLKLIWGEGENSTQKETITETERFYGPTFNCDDLGKLGYTLNGYYLVNSYGKLNNKKKDIVLCGFKQSPLADHVKHKEQRLGYIVASEDLDFESFCNPNRPIERGLAWIKKPLARGNVPINIGFVRYASRGSTSNSISESSIGSAAVKNEAYTCDHFKMFYPLVDYNAMRFLGVSNYTEGSPIRSGSRLMIFQKPQPKDFIRADIIWVQTGERLCSFVGDQCLTISFPKTAKKEAIVTLMPYNKSDASQEWVGTFQKVFHHSNWCLTYDDSRPKAQNENNKPLLPSEWPVGAKPCNPSNVGHKWIISSISSPVDKLGKHAEILLQIKNSISNI